MPRWGKTLILIAIVLGAAVFLVMRADNGDGPPYSPFLTDEPGTSLLFDTLQHMGYPVRMSYAPLTRTRNNDHVHVIIQPFNPPVTTEMAEEMLEWVYSGGRLIFLHNNLQNEMNRLLPNDPGRMVYGLAYFYHGAGSVVTGRANPIVNRSLLDDAAGGAAVHSVLSEWGADRIYFVVYYHGFHPPETMFSSLPLVVRLVLIQLGITVLMLLWHVGKRFGRAIPAFEETEREENEQVRAVARLYMKTNAKEK
ncbi:MAG: DUF4350 domain-containing protein [Defluviitaleaceae bacterium]|nr:DUF4350 domain-containing protein [Defluviitaleaceae bacterium]